MRAREFVAEQTRIGKITKRQQWPTRGLHKYRPGGPPYSSTYLQNRVMMAAACTDGTDTPEVHSASWVGAEKTAHPYTDEEAEILKRAYDAVGAEYSDVNAGDLRSQEPPGGNSKSPVTAFKGYPR